MGHVIKLGTVSALRDYSLKQQGSGIAWSRGPANPFAATVNTSGIYDRVDTWNEWVQEDWQTGVGRVDPQEGGFLYGETETRVPNQLILPPLLRQVDRREIDGTLVDCRYMPQDVTGFVTVGAGGHEKIAIPFTTPSSISLGGDGDIHFWVYMQVPPGMIVIGTIYSNDGGSPGTDINDATFADSNSPTTQTPTFQWYSVQYSTSGLSVDTQYWLVIEEFTGPNGDCLIATGSSGYATVTKSFNDESWADITSTYAVYTSNLYRPVATSERGNGIIRFNNVLYIHKGENLYKYDSADEQLDSVGTITGTGDVTSLAVFGPTLYFGRSSGNYTTMSTSESFTAASTNGRLFVEFKGLLYRAWQNDLYYSANGSTWTGPFAMGGDDVEIRGMAGMGDSFYCATDKALLRLAPGDFVEEVARFGAVDSTNGLGMLEYQGRLYIPVAGRLFRFDPSGQLMDIWVNRDDDLPSSRFGDVVKLERMNNWLIAFNANRTSDSILPSLWAWQEEGWHFVVSMGPYYTAQGDVNAAVYYDRSTSRLWFIHNLLGVLYVDIDDYTLNPYHSSDSRYMPYGWIEQDRFYGGQYLLDKDWESVTIVGDNLSTDVHVKVYWQDEASTDWELLGTADSDGEELRWSDHSTRPQGKWIKLGLRLQTNDGSETPRVRAVIVKFLPMANDRIRDTVTLTLKDNIQMPDGTPDTFTLAQQLTHVQGLIESVIPIIYEDPLGVQYEARVVDYSMSMPIFAYEGSGNVVKEMEATLVLEQVPDSHYTPPA